mgnify:CR=1 FL=1|jgi:hypothetical protein
MGIKNSIHLTPADKYIQRVGDIIHKESVMISGRSWKLRPFLAANKGQTNAAKTLWVYAHWVTPLGEKYMAT